MRTTERFSIPHDVINENDNESFPLLIVNHFIHLGFEGLRTT